MKFAVLLAVVILVMAIFVYPQRKPEPTRSPQSASVMEDISIVHVHLDRTDWTAQIKKAVLNSDSNVADITGIDFIFPKHSLSVSADSGTYSFLSDDLQLQGSVHARSGDIDIYLDSIRWSSEERTLSSSSHALIEGREFRVNGTGLTVLSDGVVRLQRDVRAIITPDRSLGGR